MIFNEYKKLNNFSQKTHNNTQSEPKKEETSRNMIYKKYKSSNIFETNTVNNNETRSFKENTILNVIKNFV